MNSSTVVVDRPIGRTSPPVLSATNAITGNVARPAYLVDVSRPDQPWRWRDVLRTPFELLALAWSVPFVILLIGIPIALVVAFIYSVGRFFLR